MERFKFSLIFKILFLLIEIIILGNAFYNISKNIIISILCYIIFTAIFIFENCFYSCIAFKNDIKVLNKFKIKTIKYSEIREIKVFKSIAHAFLIGADIDINLVFKNNNVKKIHLGPIIRYNKLISIIKDISKNKCIKFYIDD